MTPPITPLITPPITARVLLALAMTLAITALAPGCGGDDPDSPRPRPRASGSANGDTNGDANGAGDDDQKLVMALVGRVTFDGVAPEPAVLDLSSEPSCHAAHEGPVLDERLLVSADGGLADAVVRIAGGLEGRTFDVPDEPAVLEQSGCVFRPHVLVVRARQRLSIVNGDTVSHNVRASCFLNDGFNITQASRETTERVFGEVEVPILLQCDVHRWMKCHLAVVDNPFAAVTDADGRFRIEATMDGETLEPGEYTVEIWHEECGAVERTVVLEAAGATTLEVALAPPD